LRALREARDHDHDKPVVVIVDGPEVLRRLAADLRAADPPVRVLLLARPDRSTEAELADCGVTASLLYKPLISSRLTAALRVLVSERPHSMVSASIAAAAPENL
jgi:CheY-like chemotaxis protein